MKQPKILVLGDANVDLVIPLIDRSTDPVVQRDSALELHGGGTAANVAVALARLGDQVSFMGTVGDDGYGRWVKIPERPIWCRMPLHRWFWL